MGTDPRLRSDGYYNEYKGTLSPEAADTLTRYGNHVRFTIERSGSDCNITLFYAKRTSRFSVDVSEPILIVPVRNHTRFDTPSFLHVVREGIERMLKPEVF